MATEFLRKYTCCGKHQEKFVSAKSLINIYVFPTTDSEKSFSRISVPEINSPRFCFIQFSDTNRAKRIHLNMTFTSTSLSVVQKLK